jgi:hypothetical protein
MSVTGPQEGSSVPYQSFVPERQTMQLSVDDRVNKFINSSGNLISTAGVVSAKIKCQCCCNIRAATFNDCCDPNALEVGYENSNGSKRTEIFGFPNQHAAQQALNELGKYLNRSLNKH